MEGEADRRVGEEREGRRGEGGQRKGVMNPRIDKETQ